MFYTYLYRGAGVSRFLEVCMPREFLSLFVKVSFNIFYLQGVPNNSSGLGVFGVA